MTLKIIEIIGIVGTISTVPLGVVFSLLLACTMLHLWFGEI